MGMDTHKQFSFVTALTEKGDVIKQEKQKKGVKNYEEDWF